MAVLNSLITLFNSGEIKKANYISALQEGEKAIRNILDSRGYDYNKTERINLFRVSDDVRLSEAKAKMEKMKENPAVSISEYVQSLNRIFDNFLEMYNFGWCRELQVNESGTVHIQLCCHLHAKSFDSNPASSKINFKMQIDRLKSVGFEMGKDQFGDTCFIDNGHNMDLMKKFWSERGARGIQMSTRGGAIHELEFYVSNADMEKFDIDSEKVQLFVSDELNDDETMKIKKLISEIESTISFNEPTMIHTCGSIVESYFSEISEIIGYDGEIRKAVTDRHVSTRKINQEIRDIEESIGEMFPAKMAKDVVKEIYTKLYRMTVNKIGFSCHDFHIDKYGYVNVKLSFCAGHHFFIGQVMSDEDTKNTFTTIGDCRDNDNLFIVDDSDNKKKILQILRGYIPSLDIRDINVNERNGEFVIRSMNVFIRNAVDLINLPEGVVGEYEI